MLITSQRHRYWDTTISGEPISLSRASILETVSKVTVYPPKIKPKSTMGAFMSFFLSVQHFFGFFGSHPFIALGMVVGFFTFLILFNRSRSRRSYGKGSLIHLGEKEGLLGGLGNGNGGAKHD
jgi:protein disulfide-isomerase